LRVADASEAAERRELLARMGAALERLPHELKEAFLLCEVEELSGVEAARALDVRPGTLWRRLHEARKRLRAALDEEGA
jgi:RNA polymerase sigma-70 factor (ECF subfamily)